jgi:hypothetical protein
MSARLVAAAVGLLLLAGCAGADEAGKPAPAPPPAAVDQVLPTIERTHPGTVLQDFVRAAARGDDRRMWERLSAPTRLREGRSFVAFRRGAARALRQELEAIGRRHELILSQSITPLFAVAAVARGPRVYATALRRENGLWRVELSSPVQIEPLQPKPGETIRRRTQLAAEVQARAEIVEAGLWLDGLAFPSHGGGPTLSALTMFGETSRLSPGAHTVVAFASTVASASARAWSFRAVR